MPKQPQRQPTLSDMYQAWDTQGPYSQDSKQSAADVYESRGVFRQRLLRVTALTGDKAELRAL